MRYLFVCLLSVGIACAEEKPARIEGKVLNQQSGEPVRKVELTLERTGGAGRGSAGGYRALSEATGAYIFDGIPAGTYRLSVSRQGFVPSQYGAKRSNRPGTPLTLVAGQALIDLTIRLTPQAVIAGRVVDDDGDPVSRVTVFAMRLTATGKLAGQPTTGTFTNDVGEFRIGELDPGSYKLVAERRTGPTRTRRADHKPEEAFVRTYYPGVIEADPATPVQVTAGQVVTGAEIRLQKSPVFRVRGRIVANDSGEPANRLNLLISQEEMDSRMMGGPGANIRPDGTFEFVGVPPGRHVLSIMGPRGVLLTKQNLTVAGRDTDDLAISIPAPVTLNGTLAYEDPASAAQPQSGRGVSIELAGQGNRWANAPVRPDGAFTISYTGRERYRLRVNGLAANLYLKSARLGEQEVLDAGLDLENVTAGTTLQLVVGTTSAVVRGTVVDDRQQPVEGATVVLLHEPITTPLTREVMTATADQNGVFAVTGAVPGVQYAMALDDWDRALLQDDAFLKKLAEKATRLDLKSDSQETIRLKLVPLDQ